MTSNLTDALSRLEFYPFRLNQKARSSCRCLAVGASVLKPAPNLSSDTHRRIGMVSTCRGDQQIAIHHFNRSLELNPVGDPVTEWFLGIAFFNAREYEWAIDALQSCGVVASEVFAWLAAAYAQNGQIEKAVEQGERFTKTLREEIEIAGGALPNSWLEFLLERAPYADEKIKDHFIEGLRLANIE